MFALDTQVRAQSVTLNRLKDCQILSEEEHSMEVHTFQVDKTLP